MNTDVEKTKVMDGLTQALEAAKSLERQMLVYLIDMAMTEARYALYGEKPKEEPFPDLGPDY